MPISLNVSADMTLDLEQIIGQCIAILGIRGSGKSNTAGVIFEELLSHNYPLSIVDIDGEYFGLKERYEVLVVGHGEGVEIDVDSGCAAEIARIGIENSVPVVLDLSGFLAEERAEFLTAYMTALWDLAGKLRRPYIIGIEEAHEFIPQGVRTRLKELISRIALRGRKRGLGAIIVSQRSAKVEKDVLSQAGVLFLHRVVHEADMRVYGELLPWRKSEVKEMIGALETGDCVYINGDRILPIYVRERETFHGGFTPSLHAVETPELKQVNKSVIEAIERAKRGRGRKSEAEELKARLEKLEVKLAERDKKILELEEVARTLGYIKVELPAPSLPKVQSISKAVVHSVERTDHLHRGERSPHFDRTLSAYEGDGEDEVERGAIDDRSVIDLERTEAQDELPEAVERHIERLVSRVARGTVTDKRLLSFVLCHAPNCYSVGQIAAWTGCAQGVMESAPPREFLDMGLVSCERRSDGLHYRSDLKAFVVREFGVYSPDVGTTELRLVAERIRIRVSDLAAISS